MNASAITAKELRWLVCPVCHGTLEVETGIVCCTGCSRRYPVVDGIPVLLADRTI